MSDESRQFGQIATVSTIYLFALLSAFQMGVWKSIFFTILVALCCVFQIGQQRLAQVSVVLLFLTLAVSAEVVPPVSQWGPVAQVQLKALKSAAVSTP